MNETYREPTGKMLNIMKALGFKRVGLFSFYHVILEFSVNLSAAADDRLMDWIYKAIQEKVQTQTKQEVKQRYNNFLTFISE